MSYYAALVSLIQLLKEINHPEHLYSNSLLDKQQIHVSLYESLSHLQELLEDHSPKDTEVVDILERRITDAAYRAQDIIESHISDQISRQPLAEGSDEVTLDNTVAKEYNEELEKVKEEVDSIVEELMRINMESHTTHEDNLQETYYSEDTGASKQVPSGENTMVGFDEQLTTIKAQLCGVSSKREVVSIVGMGGIGKTTLARNIFDDKLIHEYFHCCAWVTISQDYHLRDILLAIVNSLNINKGLHGVAEEVLKEYIYKHLNGRRYLIIVDDVWDSKVWDDIRRIFPDDSNGSRVMITTRLLDIAVYTDSLNFLHQMQFLNEDQSWILFRGKAFCPPELEDIGRAIAKNCRGLPLAIVVVAGLLSKVNMKRSNWEKIASGVSSTLAENDEHFSKILSLSYIHLPHHLKPCFLYLGGFPEDYEISVSKLIKLWVAEGFLKPIESRSSEEVAEEYLEDLVGRNLVLVTKKRSNGKFRYCRIHDLLRDLCAQRARCVYISNENDNFCLKAMVTMRRLYIHGHSRSIQEESGSYIRSILYCYFSRTRDTSLPLGLKLLRVLDAENILFLSFPDEILVLFHLRYLSLVFLECSVLPSISKLHNLQTFIAGFQGGFISGVHAMQFSSEIWKMPHLRHIMISGIDLGELHFLGRLQTLSRVINFRFTTHNIGMIPSLKNLKIFYTGEEDQNWHEFCLNNLILLDKLETLDFKMFPGRSLPMCFPFPANLKKLNLSGGNRPWKDMTVVGSLPNLQVLKLRFSAFVGEEWEPIEGEFPKLKFLLMGYLNLKYWRAEKTHFPCLEQLVIKYCMELEEIPSEIGDIPTLQLIALVNCNSAVNSSALNIQKEQGELGNDIRDVLIHQFSFEISAMDNDFGWGKAFCTLFPEMAKEMVKEIAWENAFGAGFSGS